MLRRRHRGECYRRSDMPRDKYCQQMSVLFYAPENYCPTCTDPPKKGTRTCWKHPCGRTYFWIRLQPGNKQPSAFRSLEQIGSSCSGMRVQGPTAPQAAWLSTIPPCAKDTCRFTRQFGASLACTHIQKFKGECAGPSKNTFPAAPTFPSQTYWCLRGSGGVNIGTIVGVHIYIYMYFYTCTYICISIYMGILYGVV